MPNRQKKPRKPVIIAAVSGGPDSVYLLRTLSRDQGNRIVIGHVNYGTRGTDSAKDQEMVEKLGKACGYDTEILVHGRGRSAEGAVGVLGVFPAGFERKARDIRYRFLRELSDKVGAKSIALAHTADDQVETILMRVFEGAGIGGLKGIPRETDDGIVRPILDVWKEDILGYLKKRKIPYRNDRSNSDTRFERNWVRKVLLPLLVKRYGKTLKKRIFTLGERFRELDDYLEAEAGRWVKGRLASTFAHPSWVYSFRREKYSVLPTVLRVKILQGICFDRLGVAPNERLLMSMDRNIRNGGPSAKVNIGKGWELANRYGEAVFLPGEKRQGRKDELVLESRGRITVAQAKRLATKGNTEVFDAAGLALPLTVRPMRAGDRIRPFGRDAGAAGRGSGKKVKEILIDRKVPREERWGRPVVCDAEGKVLWIPGILRSSHAPVTAETRKTALLRIRASK
ncbi:MAG: tRNA lysidine(34) synthetase TilS [bacterium]|jgi:tRNA(Ile)-lysidine synthase